MNIVQKIEMLASKRGESINSIEQKVGISRGIIRSWEHKQPTADKIVRVADYLDVSIDYLLGRTSLPDRHKDDDEDIVCLQRARARMSDADKKNAIEIWKLAFGYAFKDEEDT